MTAAKPRPSRRKPPTVREALDLVEALAVDAAALHLRRGGTHEEAAMILRDAAETSKRCEAAATARGTG